MTGFLTAESVCQEESCPDIPKGGQAGGQRAKAHGDGSALKIGRNCMFGQGENEQGFDVRYGLF